MDRNHRSQPQHPLYLGQIQAYQIPVDTIKAFEGDLAIDWSQLTGKPTTLAGYSIDDDVAALFTAAGFGAGTAGKHTKWSDTDTIVNSILSESGTVLTQAGTEFHINDGTIHGAFALEASRLDIGTVSNHALGFFTNSTLSWQITASGHFIAQTDGTFDMGAIGANRPRDLYLQRYAILSGGLQMPGVLSPAQITSNQNNYNPTGFLTSSMVRLSTDTTRTITGFGRDAAAHVKLLMNVGGFNITFTHLDAGSAANQQISCPNATSHLLRAGQACFIVYDPVLDKWRLLGTTP